MSSQYGTRRKFIRHIAICAGATAWTRLVVADDGNKVAKQAAGYQEQPNDGEQCSGCALYNAESKTCQVVAGDISPAGWCKLYSPKQ